MFCSHLWLNVYSHHKSSATLSPRDQSFRTGDWPRQMSPSWMMVCLQTLQCLAFLKVFTRNVWEWRASNSSGCSKENNNKRQKEVECLVSKCCDMMGLQWVQVVWVLLDFFLKRRCFAKYKTPDYTHNLHTPHINFRSDPLSRVLQVDQDYFLLPMLKTPHKKWSKGPLRSTQEVMLQVLRLAEQKLKKVQISVVFLFSFTIFLPAPPSFCPVISFPSSEVCCKTVWQCALPQLNIPLCLSAACCVSSTVYHLTPPVLFLSAL